MILEASQVRQACALLAWTPVALAGSAMVTLAEATKAWDDLAIMWLGGLQLHAMRQALEGAGIVFVGANGHEPSARLRKGVVVSTSEGD